jgi:hypothetical protein
VIVVSEGLIDFAAETENELATLARPLLSRAAEVAE